MVAFYNQEDQDIYKTNQFMPQSRFLLNAPKPVVEEEKVTESFGIPNTNAFNNSGGNDFSVYNPDPNSIVNRNYNSRPAYETAFGTNLGDPEFNRATGALNSSGVLGDYREKPLTGTQEFLKFAGSFAPGKGIANFLGNQIGPYLPVNRRAIMENELGGKGIMVNNIGQVVQGKGDYNTAENVMAGYNADLITQKTIDKRQGKIEDTLRDKYNLTKSEIDSIKAGDITKDIIDKTKGSKLVDRYGAVGEYGDINNLTNKQVDEMEEFEKEQKKKLRSKTILGKVFGKKKQKKKDAIDLQNKINAANAAAVNSPDNYGVQGLQRSGSYGGNATYSGSGSTVSRSGDVTNKDGSRGNINDEFAKGGRVGYFFGGRVNFKDGGLASIL